VPQLAEALGRKVLALFLATLAGTRRACHERCCWFTIEHSPASRWRTTSLRAEPRFAGTVAHCERRRSTRRSPGLPRGHDVFLTTKIVVTKLVPSMPAATSHSYNNHGRSRCARRLG
jgi:hypothetical protein